MSAPNAFYLKGLVVHGLLDNRRKEMSGMLPAFDSCLTGTEERLSEGLLFMKCNRLDS